MRCLDLVVVAALALSSVCCINGVILTDCESRETYLAPAGYAINDTDGVPMTFIFTPEPDQNLFLWYPPIVDDANKLTRMITEIPSGTNDKWATDQTTGIMTWLWKDGKPRTVDYIQYPGTFGIVPRSIEKGSDDGAAEIFLIGDRYFRAEMPISKVVGVLILTDGGAIDNRIISVPASSGMYSYNELAIIDEQFPGTIAILSTFFSNYKGIGSSPAFYGTDDSTTGWNYLIGGVTYLNYTGEDHTLPVVTETCPTILEYLADGYTTDGIVVTNTDNPTEDFYRDYDYYDHSAAGYYSVYQVVTSPSGDIEKWEVSLDDGRIYRTVSDTTPVNIDWIGYPGNVGIIPRTLLNGEAMEVVTIGKQMMRAQLVSAKLVGLMTTVVDGKTTQRALAIAPGPAMWDAVGDIDDLDTLYPGVSYILNVWYSNVGRRNTPMQNSTAFSSVFDAYAVVQAANTAYLAQSSHVDTSSNNPTTPSSSSDSVLVKPLFALVFTLFILSLYYF
ncbi:inorganic diphosphatase [Pelomyxa schiedti]|nr:inorganic diphosphatase [Pelomyxa schiedti]